MKGVDTVSIVPIFMQVFLVCQIYTVLVAEGWVWDPVVRLSWPPVPVKQEERDVSERGLEPKHRCDSTTVGIIR